MGALKLTRERVFKKKYGMRDTAPNVVILITDGENTINSTSYPFETEKLKNTGVKVSWKVVDWARI